MAFPFFALNPETCALSLLGINALNNEIIILRPRRLQAIFRAISSKTYPKHKMLNRISSYLSRNILLRIYKQTILTILDYSCLVGGDCGKQNAQRLERLQNKVMRIILSSHRESCKQDMRATNKVRTFIPTEPTALPKASTTF